MLLRSFLHVKDELFREYMGRKKEQYEEDDAGTLTIDKLIMYAQNKYNEHTDTNNNVWGTASRRLQEIVELKVKMSKMRGGLNLIPKILKKHEAGWGLRRRWQQ